jgi:hypothetical protein
MRSQRAARGDTFECLIKADTADVKGSIAPRTDQSKSTKRRAARRERQQQIQQALTRFYASARSCGKCELISIRFGTLCRL